MHLQKECHQDEENLENFNPLLRSLHFRRILHFGGRLFLQTETAACVIGRLQRFLAET